MEKNVEKSELDQLRFQVKTQAVNLLLYGKTPAYEKRFKSWAKNTYGEHLHNLVDAMLSSTAYAMVTGRATVIAPNISVEYLRGQTNGILMMLEFIKTYASDTAEEANSESYGSLSDLLDD